MEYATYSPEARTALQAQGKTDDQIADMWATTNPGFKQNIEKIRQGAKSNPKATTAFMNYYLYGDAKYNQQANVNSPKVEDTSIGAFGSNALKRFLTKTWDYTQTDYQKKQAEISQRYQSGEQGLANTMAQGALATVSGIAGPAKALWEVGLTTDIPFTDTSAADIVQPAIENVLESKPGQAAMEKVGQWNEFAETNPTARTVNAGLLAGFDAANLAGAGVLERPFQASMSTVKGLANPVRSAKAVGKSIVQSHPIDALRALRSGKTPSVGSVATDAIKRSGVDERLAIILTEGGADTAAYKRIVQSYEAAAKDFRAPNPKEIVGETAIMTYRHLEDLRKGVGGMIGNVVKAHAAEPLKLPNTYQKLVSWMEERGVYVSEKGKLERIGSSIPESDVRYLQSLHDDVAGIANFKQGDNIRRVIFKEQDLAKRQGIEYGDDAKQAAQAVHSSMLEEMGTAVPSYRVYAAPYAQIRKAQNTFAQKLGKGSYKEIDLRKLRAGEIAKRMTGEASADMTDAFQMLEETARKFGYEGGTSVRNQALFERAISQYFPTYSQGGLQGSVEAAGMKTAVDAGLAIASGGQPYSVARAMKSGLNLLTGKSAEKQLKVIKNFLEGNSDELAAATTPEQVEAILQRMFGENYVPPAVRNLKAAPESPATPQTQVLQGQGVPQASTEMKALPSTLPDSPPPVNSPKANPPMARGAAAKNVMSSVKGNSLIKDKKLILREKKYPIQEVNQFLDDNFNVSKYASLQGKDNVYIVAPSTSGKNTIPLQMAQRLQAQYGGQVMDNAILGIGRTEAKGKNFLEKALSKSDFELAVDTSALQGKNIVLVDDIFTSGGTVKGINDVLATKGVPVNDIAVLSAGDVRFASQKDLARIAKKLSENVGIDEVEAKSLVDNLEGISKTGANQIELNLNRNPQKIYDRLREASTSARRTQRPPSGGATVKGAGDTKGDNVGVGKMEKRERQAFGAGEDALPKALPREGGEAAGKTMNKTPINRPIEAEAARIKMEDAFKEINDQVAKTGTVNAKKWREANDLAKEYWKTRDALDAKGTAALQNPPLSAKIGDMTKTKLPPHLQNLVDKFDGATRIDDVTPEGFGPMKTAKEPTLIDKLPNEDWAQAKMRLLQNQIDNGTVSLKQIPESSGGHGWEAKILAGEQVRSFRGFKKQDVIDDIFDELYPNAKFVKDSPLPKADLLAEARKAKNVREFTESQLKKKYGLRNEEDITITARRQYDTSTRLEKSVRKIENKIKEQVENEFNFEYLKKNPEKLTEEIRDAANSRLKELEDKSAELSNAKKAAMEFYSSRIDTNEAYKELDRLTSLWKEANQSQ